MTWGEVACLVMGEAGREPHVTKSSATNALRGWGDGTGTGHHRPHCSSLKTRSFSRSFLMCPGLAETLNYRRLLKINAY